MNGEKRTLPFISIGSSSLLVVFLVVGIMTFAVLSFVSANNDYEYSRKIALQKEQYYDACNLAEEALWKLSNPQDGVSFPAAGTYTLTFPIDSNRLLSVVYEVKQPEEKFTYEILEWKVQLNKDWEGNDNLSLPVLP